MRDAHRPSWKPKLIHGLRIGLLIALAVPLRLTGAQHSVPPDLSGGPPLAGVRDLLPAAAALSAVDAKGAWWRVLDRSGQPIALAAQTSPVGDSAVGYRGPSNVLLIAGTDQQIAAAALIESRDTPEHVRAVTASETFFAQFRGLAVGHPVGPIDAVSGATLTSYAIAEAVSLRLAGERPSLRFPRPLSPDEASLVIQPSDQGSLPLASSAPAGVAASAGAAPSGSELVLRDAAGNPAGRLLRTGPLVDSVIGYQGPSEVLLALDGEDRVIGAQLRETYDNEPYVDYVREEAYFWERFEGRSLNELAALDPLAAGIEGVSGATMTSQAVAETIQAAAQRYRAAEKAVARQRKQAAADSGVFGMAWSRLDLRWSWKDVLSVAFVLGAIAFSSTRLRGIRSLRVVWQISLVLGFGWLTGNLLSQALIFGWAEQGVAWRLAPALTLVVATALLLPPLSKRNVYCHHLCPHGAAQQLLRGRLRWTWTPGPRLGRGLAAIPGLLLIAAYLLMLVFGSAPLAHWEPFDAYLWPVAAWGSVVLAGVSLAVAAVVPMGYCRFGCPTGRLLDYIRRSARSDRLTQRDAVVSALALFGWAWALRGIL